MKIIGIVFIALLAALGVYGLTAAKSDTTPPASSFSSVQSDIKVGAKLYDVRTPAEYRAGHIENATNLPLGSIQAGALASVPKGQKIYVYCQSGNRSSQATALLKQAGITNVIDLGGIRDVQSSGGKLIQ